MPTEVSQLIIDVNNELENRTYYGSSEITADGVVQEWLVAPHHFKVIDDADFMVLKDGVEQTETTHYTMDYDTGRCSMVTLPAAGVSMKWYFNYNQWSDGMVLRAINAGIQSLFPSAYVGASQEKTANGTTTDFALSAATVFVTGYDWKATGGTTYTKKRRSDFEMYNLAGVPYVSFFKAPSAGTLLFHTIGRPAAVTSAQDLGDCGIDDRFQHPIVSYACYHLLNQKVAPRARGDVAIITQGVGTLSPRQMNDAANAFFLRHQMQLAQMKMPPWSSR